MEIIVRCSFCDAESSSREELTEHSIKCLSDIDDELLGSFNSYHEDAQSFKCEACDWTGPSAKDYDEHIKTKHLGIKYPCEKCEYIGINKKKLQIHTQGHWFNLLYEIFLIQDSSKLG